MDARFTKNEVPLHRARRATARALWLGMRNAAREEGRFDVARRAVWNDHVFDADAAPELAGTCRLGRLLAVHVEQRKQTLDAFRIGDTVVRRYEISAGIYSVSEGATATAADGVCE